MDPLSIENIKQMAETFVGQLLKADFNAAVTKFDDQLGTVMTEAKLQETWQNVTAEAGVFLELTTEKTSEVEGYTIINIKCHFQRFNIDVQVVFNNERQISGLNIKPVQMVYNPPEYVNESVFHEVDVTVGEGKWALPGTLTIPDGPGPFKGVVLVHGSGPNDRDETVGMNKPFRDLAWGLASQGVAVLRYEKRTFKHSKEFTPDLVAEMTVKEEVIDDALLGIQLMRENDSVDPKKVFLLGHSLGATVAPRIGLKDPNLAGLIIMAGITRSLENIILDQFTYLYSLSDNITAQQENDLEDLRKKVAKLNDPEMIDNITAQDMPLGISVAYWRDLHDNTPLDAVEKITMPILILQGERDYQVLKTKDFEEGWKKALSNRKNVSFKLFPRLNHLFIAGEGKSTPQEYNIEGHVDKDVIEVIVQWMGKQ